MNKSFVGTVVGMALAFAGFFGGFGAFVLVAALGAAGWAIGRWLDGGGRAADLRDAYDRVRR